VIKAKNPQNQILPIWQPVGYSTYQITSAVAQKYGMKATHTGVLDPLAEGVILVLLGSERFNKSKFTDFHKEYEFEISLGIATDSYDGMGLITEYNNGSEKLTLGDLQLVVKGFVGDYTQKVPLYSARKVNSKKLFLYPKEKLTIPELPEKSGKIYKIECSDLGNSKLYSLVDEIIAKIEQVKKGEYRQKEIIQNWKEFKSKNTNWDVQTAAFCAELSRGLYVRSLSQDIVKKLGKIGFVSKLVRTGNGEYTKENSCTLNELFGENFDHEMLLSKFTM